MVPFAAKNLQEIAAGVRSVRLLHLGEYDPSGVHVFSATLKTLGIQTLIATDKTTSSIKGMETGIQVNSAASAVITELK